jgi:hydroxymethylpyrimidine/phosphomethylpyrimidine kinase
MAKSKRPFVLSIAGFDPSGGAGLLADIKTMESNKVYGLGVVSALTYQNDTAFEKVDWVSLEKIIEQITVLQNRFEWEYVKIGLMESPGVLYSLISELKSRNPKLKLIWDPIWKASAGSSTVEASKDGFAFHGAIDRGLTEKICRELFLITPNMDEIRMLTGQTDEQQAAKDLSSWCHVFLKGGHMPLYNQAQSAKERPGRDFLFTRDGKTFSFRPKEIAKTGKHGSGCVLSSAITANLAKGFKLNRACLNAKDYTTKFLLSNKTLLGYHKI